MSIVKLKQLLKKKGIQFTFLIVCSLFICENTLAGWGQNCCFVNYLSSNPISNENRIQIYFKFFEYDLESLRNQSFIEEFKAEFSTDGGNTYIHLMSASCKNQIQKSKHWAWICVKDKRIREKISLHADPVGNPISSCVCFNDSEEQTIYVKNHPRHKNQNWLWVYWYPMEDKKNITHVRVITKWIQSGSSIPEVSKIVYPIYRKKKKLNSNCLIFSNSCPKQKIKTEDAINTVKAYREANTIVLKGALSETIHVYTTTGKLIKSIVADNDIVKVELSEKQVYIVNVGQIRYKIAL